MMMMFQIMMMKTRKKINSKNGFTFCELIVVMAIISVSVAMTIPFSGNSDAALEIKQDAMNLVEFINCAIEIHDSKDRDVRLRLDKAKKFYLLEFRNQENDFEIYKQNKFKNHISAETRISECEGFSEEGGNIMISFETNEELPEGKIVLSNNSSVYAITIRHRDVEFSEIK